MKAARRLPARRRICVSAYLSDFAAAKIRSDKHIQRKEAKIMETKYKINIHILEACNFRCRQCFSKFGTKKLLPVEG